VWRRPDPDPPLTWDDVNAIIEALMRIGAQLEDVLAILKEERDGEEEEEPDE
jgi:hypothetical protein